MKYSTQEKERKGFAIVMLIILLVLLVGMILTVCGVFDDPGWQPVEEYPIANQHITWTWAGRRAGK